MKKYFLLCIVFFVVFLGCKNENGECPNELIQSNLELQSTGNSRFIETLIYYEETINFTDSVGSTVKSYLNPYEITEQYIKVLSILSESRDDKKGLVVQVNDNLDFLLDSLIKRNIEFDRRVWKKYVDEVKDNISNIKSEYGNNTLLNECELNQLKLKVGLIYNLVFQLIHRHKMEEEFMYEIRYPIIVFDSLLPNGKRMLGLQACSAIIGNGQSLEIHVDGQRVHPVVKDGIESGDFLFTYDPRQIKDSIPIKTVSRTYLNGEVVESEMKYKTKN